MLCALYGSAALAAAMSFIDKEADGKGVKGSGSEEGRELLDRLEGRRVRITGVFDHSREVLVGESLGYIGTTHGDGTFLDNTRQKRCRMQSISRQFFSPQQRVIFGSPFK